MHYRITSLFLVLWTFVACKQEPVSLTKDPANDLHFPQLATTWDEAVPLGNGMVGALVWNNNGKLRLSLDRADLWDLRPMENLKKPEWSFQWVYEQWKNDNYKAVQEKFDAPYDRAPAPSKIPAGALEFDIEKLGSVDAVHLSLKDALCEVKWKEGSRLLTFVHATEPVGWFRFEGVPEKLALELIKPAYNLKGTSGEASPVSGQDLRRLGYKAGSVESGDHQITYNQEGWGGFKYQIHVKWKETNDGIEGCWSISSKFAQKEEEPLAQQVVSQNWSSGMRKALDSHLQWWKNYWAQSTINLPDPVLQKQWCLEMYKFGAAARKDAPPISLQAVWTADNGKLPPWKGDFHHDLNTQLSYWPAYSGNHLDLEEGYLNWLWNHRTTFKKYTKDYFGTNGMNVPGVTTLTGDPMGGWIQYSFGSTVGAWLGHHFYMHWRYSMDRDFLKERAYPWIHDVAVFLEELSVEDKNGMRKLPISSSPEINDNSRNAWFPQNTNYDLSLIRWTFTKAGELAAELEKNEEAAHWKNLLAQWPNLAVDEETGLMFAPGFPYNVSHRHFSHQMGYHPLGLLDVSNSPREAKIIKNTIENLKKHGSDWWTGYSFSWLGNLQARALDGEGAAESLRTFAECFCLPNSFHVNGDQSGTGKSKFRYRPFTLEGNFAFASGVQEMLIQSHTGVVKVFPAIPKDWKDVAFSDLRTEGAFLVSAQKENGKVVSMEVTSEKGGTITLENPFENGAFVPQKGNVKKDGNHLVIEMNPGEVVSLKNK